ncbi:DUF3313 family protein [Akkermansia glycaniphila]|uniref:DUF3313 family protein n=1 Tax=Akkermansia glycaniphila TaxID=1679444 RepID=UPI001C016F05|nr:DUF3313 family protein [Akkermansia glycaniphila]MBT9449859.1 DUF3313 family protein [Akkermansia glycaniphila]
MKLNHTAAIFGMTAIGLATVGCQRDLTPVSPLITHPLTHESDCPLDGIWSAHKTGEFIKRKTLYVHFAPLGTTLIEGKYPKEAQAMKKLMHDHLVKYVGTGLQDINNRAHTNWQVTETPGQADIVIETAIVKLKPTKGVVNAIGTIGSFFSPIPGTGTIISQFTKGGIGIEGRIVDTRTKRSLFEFKDTNKDNTIIFSFNDYGRFGHDEESLEKWAKILAKLIVEGAKDTLPKTGA